MAVRVGRGDPLIGPGSLVRDAEHTDPYEDSVYSPQSCQEHKIATIWNKFHEGAVLHEFKSVRCDFVGSPNMQISTTRRSGNRV